MTDPAIVDKLQEILWNKRQQYSTEGWIEYLNKYDVTIISDDELVTEFPDMINNELLFNKKWICLTIRESGEYSSLLIEKEFGLKVAALGDLP